MAEGGFAVVDFLAAERARFVEAATAGMQNAEKALAQVVAALREIRKRADAPPAR